MVTNILSTGIGVMLTLWVKFDEYSTIERDEFDKERAAHWMARFQDFKDCYSKMK